MFKRIKLLIGVIVTLIITGISTGAAFWVFSGKTKNSTFESTVNVDNIEENHNYGKPNPKNTYDIYFFPSTYYMYHQRQHYSQIGGFETNAENLFGYIDKTIKNGIVESNIYPATGVDLNTYHETYWNKISALAETNTYAPNANSNSGSYSTINFGTKNDDINDTPIPKNGTISARDREIATYDKLKLMSRTPLTNGNDSDDVYEFENKLPYYQEVNRGERLGYWGDLELTEGRLLPIKFTFSGTLNPDIFENIITSLPKSDMADKEGWHNFKFSNWVYIKGQGSTNEADYLYPGDGFTFKDLSYQFNSYNDLTSIAEQVGDPKEHRYVIRLFPYFSNGVNYEASKNDPPSAGTRDGRRFDIVLDTDSTNNVTTDCQIVSRYFTYPKELNTNDANGFDCALIENLTINASDNPKSKILDAFLRVRKSDIHGFWGNNLQWQLAWTPIDIYTNKLQELISNGVYNIYVFSTVSDFSSEREAINKLETLFSNQSNFNTAFRHLKGKELRKISSATSTFGPSQCGVNYNGKNVSDSRVRTSFLGYTTHYRAYAIYAEEVTEIKYIDNLPIVKDSTNSLVEESDGAIDSHVNVYYDKSESLYKGTKDLYIGNTDAKHKTFNATQPVGGGYHKINDDSDYIYKIDGVDLSGNNDNYFQFRFNNTFRTDIRFELNYLNKNGKHNAIFEGDPTTKPGSSVVSREVKPDGSNIFVDASEYFELVKVKTSKGTQNVLKVKNESLKGIYNIILDYDGTKVDSNNVPYGSFNIFVYRQRNIFIKVFDHELQNDCVANGLLDHTWKSKPYYSNSYFLGTLLDPSEKLYYCTVDDVDQKVENRHEDDTNPAYQPKTLTEIFDIYSRRRYKKECTTNNESDKNIYYLVDRVSHQIIMKWECVKENPTTHEVLESKIYMNQQFKIVKNHIFEVFNKGEYFKRFGEAFPKTKLV